MKTMPHTKNALEKKNTPIFTFDPHNEQNISVHPIWKKTLREYCIFIRDSIGKHFQFSCHPFRDNAQIGIKLILREESAANLRLVQSGYTHIPRLTQTDINGFDHNGLGILKSTCHFIDSTDMLHMANYLVKFLDADPQYTIEKVEYALLVHNSYG